MKRLIVLILCPLLLSCGSQKRLKEAPPLSVLLRQRTVYNGEAQPIALEAGEDLPLDIRYYTGLAALEADQGGSAEAPSGAGNYYVKISRPENSVYARGGDIIVDYTIEKAPVLISAEPRQAALYDGSPQSVIARSQPPLSLGAVYYPSAEAREAAARSDTELLKPFTRVQRAPIEPGVYYVTVFYPGDENYRYTEVLVELTITKF